MPTEIKENFYSEPVQEIMGAMPSWLTRWGVTMIACIFVVIIIGCFVIKFPQTVLATVVLTSECPPSDQNARYSGLLETVFVKNGEKVSRGELIALFRTPADYSDIEAVQRLLLDLDCQDAYKISDSILKADYNTGELQDTWLAFVKKCSDYAYYIAADQVGNQKRLVNERIAKNEEYYDDLLKQLTILKSDLEYETRTLKRDSLLRAQNVISDAEYEVSIKSWISKKSSIAGFDATLTNTELNIIQLEQHLTELDLQKRREVSEYVHAIEQLKRQLLAQIDGWKEQYAIVASSDGTVSMQTYWSSGQYVLTGETIASIVPDDGLNVIGRLQVPSSGFGKIALKQRVNVKLNGFPYMEFGVLKGEISAISPVPEKIQGAISYTVDIKFPYGLKSSYNKEFPMVQQMDGVAEIVTKERRLIELFAEPMVSLFKNR